VKKNRSHTHTHHIFRNRDHIIQSAVKETRRLLFAVNTFLRKWWYGLMIRASLNNFSDVATIPFRIAYPRAHWISSWLGPISFSENSQTGLNKSSWTTASVWEKGCCFRWGDLRNRRPRGTIILKNGDRYKYYRSEQIDTVLRKIVERKMSGSKTRRVRKPPVVFGFGVVPWMIRHVVQ